MKRFTEEPPKGWEGKDSESEKRLEEFVNLCNKWPKERYEKWLPEDEVPFDEVVTIVSTYVGKPFTLEQRDTVTTYLQDFFLQINDLSQRKREIEAFLVAYAWYLVGKDSNTAKKLGLVGGYSIHPKRETRSNIKAAKRVLDSLSLDQVEEGDRTHQLAVLLTMYLIESEKMLEHGPFYSPALEIKNYRLLNITKKMLSLQLRKTIEEHNIKISASDFKAAIDAL